MTVLITGVAGFIGSHVAHILLDRGDDVVGIDNMNDYYDPSLKAARLSRLTSRKKFNFHHVDITDKTSLDQVFGTEKIDRVINLAAQVGVRYSLKNPQAYISTNIQGFTNILETCRHNAVKHLVYASSSSVYGSNTLMPFAVSHAVDHPISLYAATKKSNELMAVSYTHLTLPTNREV